MQIMVGGEDRKSISGLQYYFSISAVEQSFGDLRTAVSSTVCCTESDYMAFLLAWKESIWILR